MTEKLKARLCIPTLKGNMYVPTLKGRLTYATKSSGTGGTTDYLKLSNKPSIEGVTLEGNKTFIDLGLENISDETITSMHKEEIKDKYYE